MCEVGNIIPHRHLFLRYVRISIFGTLSTCTAKSLKFRGKFCFHFSRIHSADNCSYLASKNFIFVAPWRSRG